MQPEELIQIARSAAEKPRIPYARFPVGAAVEGADGQIYCGCNIVSASYPLSICAERVAIFSAVAAGTMPHRLAVSCLRGDPSDPGSLMPCGACRQVMLDQMPPDATVIVDGVGEFTVANLLPLGFHLPSSDPGNSPSPLAHPHPPAPSSAEQEKGSKVSPSPILWERGSGGEGDPA